MDLLGAGVDAVVCGAISDGEVRSLLSRGLDLWSGVAGEVEDVLLSLARTLELEERFRMPGLPTDRNPIWGWRTTVDRRSDEPGKVESERRGTNDVSLSPNTGLSQGRRSGTSRESEVP